MEIKDKITTTHEIIEHDGERFRRYENGYWEYCVSGHWYEMYSSEMEREYQKLKDDVQQTT